MHYAVKDRVAFAEVFGMPLSIGEYEPVASRAGEGSNLNNCSHDGGIGVDDYTVWLSPSEKELDTRSKIKKLFTIREIAPYRLAGRLPPRQ
jgi:hypothetical protein